MLGFIFGILFVVALFAARRALRWYGPPWPGGSVSGRHRGGRPRWFLRRAFAELGTTGTQEKVILDALDEVRGEARKLRDEARELRGDLGAVMAGDTFDAARLEAAFARQDGVLAALRARLADALGRVHGTLDPDQRRRLVRLIEQPWHGRCRHRADAPGLPA
jgi:Spy/CpxP family protein refolding chaperone